MSPQKKRRKRGPSKYQVSFEKKQQEIAEDRQRRISAKTDIEQQGRTKHNQVKKGTNRPVAGTYESHRGVRISKNFTIYALACVGIAVVALVIIIPPQQTTTGGGGTNNDGGGTAINEACATGGSVTPADFLSRYRGKHLILYFGGTACIPCANQLPRVILAYNNYVGTGKVEVVTLSMESIDALDDWIEDRGIPWKVCFDTGAILTSTFNPQGYIPTLVVYDENGNEENRYIGEQTQDTINQIFQSCVT